MGDISMDKKEVKWDNEHLQMLKDFLMGKKKK